MGAPFAARPLRFGGDPVNQVMTNRLADEKSPYLLQHAHNPVDWHPWGDEAFERAGREDKPVFLSVGYSTCHWCHVMAHESFEDEEVARVLNAFFVPIKVDREERPDVDQVYMDACVATTGSGGWPLTAFLAPDQRPFYLATYLPKRARYGRPGLIELLEAVARAWREDRNALLSSAERITRHISAHPPAEEAPLTPDTLEEAARALVADYVPGEGRFGPAPLFPMPLRLLFLARQGGEGLEIARAALAQMARGGIFDHVGGGFSRYSTDEKWLVPHFEKMLYDNALLAYACAEAAWRAKDDFLARTAERTLDYVLREMTDPAGGFYCAQDADSEGREGLFYAFGRPEVQEVLGPDGAAFARRFGITDEGNFEGRSILNLLADPEFRAAWAEHGAALDRLRAYRAGRFRLHKDDKVLASWNGLMIAALSRAGALLGRTDYVEAATRATDFIKTRMAAPDSGLYARYRAGEAGIPGTLEDYAFLAWGFLEHYRATLAPESLLFAARLADEAHARFHDEAGGYFMTASHALVARPKEAYDGPIPSGNGAMALVFAELAAYSDAEIWRERLGRQLHFLSGGIASRPDAHCLGLLALHALFRENRRVVAACADEAAGDRARAALLRDSRNSHPLVLTPQTRGALHAFADQPLPEAGIVWYACADGVCEAPKAEE